jgi:hypothetical protein
MLELLNRELTEEEEVMRETLSMSLSQAPGAARAEIRELAVSAPERFFAAAISILNSDNGSIPGKTLYNHFVECPEFLVELMRPGRFSHDQLLESCRTLMRVDKALDVRLARLAPRQNAGVAGLDAAAVVRILDLLNEISSGPRLLLVLNQLTHHPDRGIANKALMLMARRVRNSQWVERQLDSGDARLRANVVEGLWGVRTPAAKKTLWSSLDDEDSGVVGNALVGLHMLGEPAATAYVRAMLQDSRPPFRWTAAWVMGKMGNEEFSGLLQEALNDSSEEVRRAVRRALIAIRQAAITRQLEAEAEARRLAEAEARRLAAEAECEAEALAAAKARAAEDDSKDAEAAQEPAPSDSGVASDENEPGIGAEVPQRAEFDLHLDGSYVGSGISVNRPKRRLWPF